MSLFYYEKENLVVPAAPAITPVQIGVGGGVNATFALEIHNTGANALASCVITTQYHPKGAWYPALLTGSWVIDTEGSAIGTLAAAGKSVLVLNVTGLYAIKLDFVAVGNYITSSNPKDQTVLNIYGTGQ